MENVGKGRETAAFLKTFEGAAATFSQEDSMWSLWLPEVIAGDRPITPASQLYFAVILRHEQQAFAIRFFYDCSTGKVRYYTSAVPEEISSAPEFENAVSELFRHTLPVEPIRQRKLRTLPKRRRIQRDSESASTAALRNRQVPTEMADPVEIKVEVGQESAPTEPAAEIKPDVSLPVVEEPSVKEVVADQSQPVVEKKTSVVKPPKVSVPEPARVIARVEPPRKAPSKLEPPPPTRAEDSKRNDSRALSVTPSRPIEVAPRPLVPTMDNRERAPADFDGIRKVQFDVGERMRSVLILVIVVCGIVSGLGIVAYTYLVMTEDPGVKHHRLQNEMVEAQRGR